ncbi:MAG TPA: glycoside hydrolase family 15 protein, partial [Pyrinomonadaceae bacterium]
MHSLRSCVLIIALNCSAFFGQTTNNAPGGPGNDAHWPSAAKTGFGTANSIGSKVWFTIVDGALSEVFYPTLDMPNVQTLQLIIVDGSSVQTEINDTNHQTEVLDRNALTFRQVNTAKNRSYTITKTYVCDPQHNTVLIDVEFSGDVQATVYVYYDPSLNNSGMHDTAWTAGDALVAQDGDKASALVSSSGFAAETGSANPEVTNGYLGTTDGLTQLSQERNRLHFERYDRAENGNVVQVAALREFAGTTSQRDRRTRRTKRVKRNWTLALGFGPSTQIALANASTSLAKGFLRVRREYETGWHKYVARLPSIQTKHQAQINMAVMVLKALEDKTTRGAIIAAPSSPWGGGPNANEGTVTGYHAVWARDLYQVATAFIAIGDTATANRALNYLFTMQQKADGSFPQNSFIDGRPIGSGLQMDQVALPLVLAFQLKKTDRHTWLKHVKPAADFIVRNGPATGQDRWEEKPGYSPATIAAEIAGLVCAARIAEINQDNESAASYRKVADEWAATLDRWTATSTGSNGNGRYYLRITEKGHPDSASKIEINSGGGTYDQREIVDGGFLELVRLGIRLPHDPLILKSIALVDKLIRVETP